MADRLRRRRILRILAVLVFLGVILVGAGALVLRSALTPERIRAEIVSGAAEATGLAVELGRADLSLLPLGVTLEDLRLTGEDPADPPVLTLDAGLARLNLRALLSRTVVVERISLTRPALFLRSDSTGVVLPGKLGTPAHAEAAPARPAEAPEAGREEPVAPSAETSIPAVAAGWRGAIERLEIVGGSFRLATPDGSEDVVLTGIDGAGDLRVEAGGRRVRSEGEVTLATLDLAAMQAYRETLDDLHPVLRYRVDYLADEERLAVEELRLIAGPLNLVLTGQLTGIPDAPHVDLRLAPETLQLDELLPLVPPETFPEGRRPTARGPVGVELAWTGPLTDPDSPPDLVIGLEFQGASLGLEGFPLGIEDLRGEVQTGPDRLRFDRLAARLGNGRLELTGTIDGLRTPATARLDAAVAGEIDLSLLEEAGFTPQGTSVGGSLTLDVKVTGDASHPEGTRLGGHLEITDATLSTADLPVPVRDVDASLSLDGRDAILDRLSGSLGRSSFRVTGRIADLLGDPHVRLRGQMPRLDLAELSAPVSANGGVEGIPGGGASDSVGAPPAPLLPPLPPVLADLELTVDSLITVGATMVNVDLIVAVRDRKARADARMATATFEGVRMEAVEAGVDVEGQTARGGFHSPRIEAHRVPLTDVKGRIDLRDDRTLEITDITAAVWTGRADGRAAVDLTDLDSPGFTIEANATELPANDFLSTLTPAKNLLSGTLDLSARFDGKGGDPELVVESLTGDGRVDARGGKLQRTPAVGAVWNALNLDEQEAIDFRDLSTAFTIRDGRLITDDLRLSGGNADWNVSGFTDFEGNVDYAVQVELNEALSDHYRKRVGRDLAALLANTTGRLVIDLKVEGPSKKPRVKVDTAKLMDRARRNAMDALGRSVKDGIRDGISNLFGKPESTSAPDSADTSAAEAPKEKPLEDALRKLLGGK
jgi:uncharacterized protein involved in outer membrane biogenesis